jgi:hypothetical protein
MLIIQLNSKEFTHVAVFQHLLYIIMTDAVDLLIVGTSFFRAMPILDPDSCVGSEMTVYEVYEQLKWSFRSSNMMTTRQTRTVSAVVLVSRATTVTVIRLEHHHHHRLSWPHGMAQEIDDSLAGVDRRQSSVVPCFINVPTMDELYSELYSSTLESLREKVV